MVSMNSSTERSADLKIYVKDVRDRQARKRAITVRSWSTVKDVKDVIQQVLQIPPSSQRLYFGPLMTSGGELPNHRSLHDAGIYRSGETLLLDIKRPSSLGESVSSLRSATADICVSSSMVDTCPRLLLRTAEQARLGLAAGLKPELVLEGSGGTYFLRDARKLKVAVFKPADEEPYAENNPRGYVKHVDAKRDIYNNELSLRAGILPGEACLREVAAFMLDHGGFTGVPRTTLAEARHPAFNTNGARLKLSEGGASVGSHSLNAQARVSSSLKKKVGSFQEFVQAECTMDDLSPSMLSVDEVHKIAILDIRLMNADRNAANLLCRRRGDNSIELIPIDHGYCLRDVCDVSWADWCWLEWPQLKEPLSEESKEYILSLDIDADAEMLKEELNLEGKSIDYFRASSKLLQAGAKAGVSLYDIATMCCRNDLDGEVPSKLEVLTSMASELASSAVENGRWHHHAASEALADQLSPDGGSLFKDAGFFNKSMSSYNLVSISGDIPATNELPGMSHATGSDTSSDTDEECDDWAAGVINERITILQSSMQGKPRSASVSSEHSSESNLSSSPKGFWYVSPGSAEDEEVDSVSDTSSWSPHLMAKSGVLDKKLDTGSSNTPRPAFADSFSGPFRLPPATVNVATFKKTASTDSDTVLKRKGSGLNRSQSYSAFSELRRMSSTFSNRSGESSGLSSVNGSEKFRVYFCKFVDLVIVREVTALASQNERRQDPQDDNLYLGRPGHFSEEVAF